jgi:hypothetical protein
MKEKSLCVSEGFFCFRLIPNFIKCLANFSQTAKYRLNEAGIIPLK